MSVVSLEKKTSAGLEPIPLPGLPVAATFDMQMLPDVLRPWIEDIAERMQCPPEVLAVSSVTGAGAILGRKVGIRPQERTDWTEVANLWGCVVGRPGTMKSPAMAQALSPLRRLQAEARERHADATKVYAKASEAHDLRVKAAKRAAAKDLADNPDAVIELPAGPDEPTLRRYIANDSNIASLGELLRQNPNGVLVERDELIGLLRGLDQEDRAEERAFYLTGWNGRDGYTFDRIMRGLDLHIPAVTLSVVGGAQPGRLGEYLRHAVKGTSADDGLMQRFSLLVWPEQSGTWRDVDRFPESLPREQAFRAFARLDELSGAAVGAIHDQYDPVPFLRFSPSALEMFREWREALEARLHGDSLHPAMASHLSKYRKAIPALALILHLIDGGTGPVSETATLRALSWSEFLESHAAKSYASVTNMTAVAGRLILKRMGELSQPFTARDVQRKGWSGLTEREAVRDALEMLTDCRYLYAGEADPGPSGGRRTVIYTTTPYVNSGYVPLPGEF